LYGLGIEHGIAQMHCRNEPAGLASDDIKQGDALLLMESKAETWTCMTGPEKLGDGAVLAGEQRWQPKGLGDADAGAR
jgi:hypothetical protein